MPTAEIRAIIPASADAAFELIHDYGRRLEWDTLLREARLEAGFDEAARGAISVCRGKRMLGGFALRTEYVSFEKGRVAAVVMLNEPPFFRSFAASIRHLAIDENRSEVIYKVNFAAKPGWLRPLLEPLMRVVFVWETRRRLNALKKYFQARAAVEPISLSRKV